MEKGYLNPSKPVEVLRKYWGYDSFRSLQEDIINNSLNGRHGLALMPTGGGKSICFQVPGMILDGICLVISPLIALMKDQVEQLKRRGINASAILSGMHKHEIDIALDNCIYGKVKFLYVSPERLKSEIFISRLKQMNISLLVIDEAHCISQWGYDFRPSYLEISEIRNYLAPKTPVLALTATATPQIQKDILTRLEIENATVFKKSFKRDNLSYSAIKTQDKISILLNTLSKSEGSSIVYVRSRKKTKYYSDLLEKKGLKASFYHAGLSSSFRDKVQSDWISGKTRIICATNAFGMGIDKPNVRQVFHLDLPDSLEAYYQEAGRAGRDEKFAEAKIIYQDKDIHDLRSKTEARFPNLETLRKVYTAICNYFQLALGSGEFQSFPLDIVDLGKKFNLPNLEIYYSIKELEKHGYIQFEENSSSYSTLNFLVDNKELYKFQVANPRYDQFIKTIVRIYGGELFSAYVRISEDYIAGKALMNHNQVIDALNFLTGQKILDYVPRSDLPRLIFLLPRQDTHQSFISQSDLEKDRKKYFDRMDAMIAYVEIQNTCRTNFLQEYFGEKGYTECGICDNCQSKSENGQKDLKSLILNHIKANGPLKSDDLNSYFHQYDPKKIAEILRYLILDGLVKLSKNTWISSTDS